MGSRMLKQIVRSITDTVQGKNPSKNKRSPKWDKVRKAHLAQFPNCAVCDGSDSLEVHHIKPFHLHPELELEDSNLITLCESKKNGVTCHLFIGHLGSYKSFNENAREDAKVWADKLNNRP